MKRVLVITFSSLAFMAVMAACSHKVVVYQYKYDSVVDEAFVKQDVDFSKYQAVMVDNVSVWYPDAHAPSPENAEKAQANLAQAQDMFREAFRNALSDRYEVTDKAGRNVLRLQVEFIDLRAVAEGDPVPKGLERYEFKTQPGHITMIAKMLDSRSGEQLARAADLGKQASAGGDGVVNWDAIASDFDYWAGVFRGWMDQVHGGG